ncbi:MAG: LysE family transporter [Legionellales bacterium]|nr:LysE family transporter [Legionellales bacterium]
MVSYFDSWLMILSASLLGSMIPGISFALVLRNTLKSSRATGIWTAFGLAMGMSIYALIVLLGLAIFIMHNTVLSNFIRWGGAAYLAYIGIGCILTKKKKHKTAILKNENLVISAKKALGMGFLTNLLNPKVMLFFLALFTQFIHPDMPATLEWVYGLTIVLVEFLWFSFVAILLTHPVLHHKFQRSSHWIERCSGVILLLISTNLIVGQLLS